LVIRWSYGYRYLLAPDSTAESSKPFVSERSSLLKNTTQQGRHYDESSDYFSTSRSATSSVERLLPNPLSSHSTSRESLTSFPALSINSTDVPSTRFTSAISSFLWQILSIMNPPLWAVLASVTVALISPLQQELFFNTHGFIHNSFILAIDTAGAVAIPLILISLGASLVKSLDVIDAPEDRLVDPKMERRGIFLALFARMVLVPLVMAPLLIAVMYFGVKYPSVYSFYSWINAV
jgi:auxin efflux carrier family protein